MVENLSESERTRVRPNLKQRLIIYLCNTLQQMLNYLKCQGMCMDGTDIGSSDHFLVWIELGPATIYDNYIKIW